MGSRSKRPPSLRDIAHEENASPDQIMASALALYAALPAVVRSAIVDTLRSPDPGAHASLIDDLARTIVAHEMRQRRDTIRRRVDRGELSPLGDLSDEEIGAEAVRLVKESRRRRAASRE